jgi:hypothetical protein
MSWIMKTCSSFAFGILLLGAYFSTAQPAPQPGAKPIELQPGLNTVAGLAVLEGAPGSTKVMFTNLSASQQWYGVTLVNQGTVRAALKGDSFTGFPPVIVEPGESQGVHIVVKHPANIQVAFAKSDDRNARGKVAWRVDLVRRESN